jgi:hypothetical protein
MSKLVQNCTAAERMRGCTFAETFRDSASIALNGGTITGTPTVRDGINLNGTTDRVTYNLTGTEFKSTEISFVIEFVPDFAADSGTNNALFDGPAGTRYLLYKNSVNSIILYVGDTTSVTIGLAAYQAYWYTGRRNVLVVCASSGNIKFYLNGVQIGTFAAVWTPTPPIILYVGSSRTPSSYFDGRILSLKVFNTLLTAQEALDIYNNTTYEYMNNAIINLPCTHEMHDPTNNKALDICNNYDATITGATKLSTRGYEIANTGSELLDLGDVTELNSASSFTMSFLFDPQIILMSDTKYLIMKLRSSTEDLRIYQNVTGFICRITNTHGLFNIIDNITNNICMSFVFDGSEATNSDRLKCYLGGREVSLTYSGTIPATTYNLSGVKLIIGYGLNGLNSYIKHFILHQEPLTPTQIADLHISMLKELNYNG